MTKSNHIDVCCLDLAGTTVRDDGIVETAFAEALGAVGIDENDPRWPEVTRIVRVTMGTSKIVVFRQILDDEARAQRANNGFEAAYARLVSEGKVEPFEGAEDAIRKMRDAGVRVALVTGFSSETRDDLLKAIGWEDIADLTVSPSDAGRGRPYPDMVLHALVRLEGESVASLAVCGDTASDAETGRRAGASIVAGVLSGMGTADELRVAGATHVLAGIAELPAIVLT